MVRKKRSAQQDSAVLGAQSEPEEPDRTLEGRVHTLEAEVRELRENSAEQQKVDNRLRSLETLLLKASVDDVVQLNSDLRMTIQCPTCRKVHKDDTSDPQMKPPAEREPELEKSPEKHTHMCSSSPGVSTTTRTDSTCMRAELFFLSELEAEDFEPTDDCQPGDVVYVIQEFLSYDSLRTWFKTDMRGQVVEIDSDGDMRVRFPCLAEDLYDVERWVHSSDFSNIHVRRHSA